jgi:hypothetical protein
LRFLAIQVASGGLATRAVRISYRNLYNAETGNIVLSQLSFLC